MQKNKISIKLFITNKPFLDIKYLCMCNQHEVNEHEKVNIKLLTIYIEK